MKHIVSIFLFIVLGYAQEYIIDGNEIVYWYAYPNKVTVGTGDSVETWVDYSGIYILSKDADASRPIYNSADSSIDFIDANNKFLTMNNPIKPGINSFTMSIMFKHPELGAANPFVFDTRAGTTNEPGIGSYMIGAGDNMRGFIKDSDNDTYTFEDGETDLDDDAYHVVSFIMHGRDSVDIYVDGSISESDAVGTIGDIGSCSSTSELKVGVSTTELGGWNGHIKAIKFDNIARSSAYITNLHTQWASGNFTEADPSLSVSTTEQVKGFRHFNNYNNYNNWVK